MYLYEMTPAQVDAAAERYYDRMLDRWQMEQEAPDAWEINNPGWGDIADMVDGYKWEKICDLVRDEVEMDADLMDEAYAAGLLDQYIAPEDEWKRKDPDDTWKLIESVFDAQWKKDDLFKAIYLWMPEKYHKAMCERLLEDADSNGIREQYNEDHRDDGFSQFDEPEYWRD